jgi:general secretion pathway protein N
MGLKLEKIETPRWIFGIGIGLIIIFVTVWQLPARWLFSSVSTLTQCKVLVDSPSGSIWQGSAAIGFSEPALDGKGCRRAMAITERLHWQMSCQVFSPGCKLSIETPALSKPLQIHLGLSEVYVQDNEARLPAEMLEVLGAPWTLLHPRAQLHARWTDLTIRENAGTGTVRISMNDLISPISQIQPLGSYDVQADLTAEGISYVLSTSKGPLLLQAQGTFGPRGVSGQGDASATPEMKEALTGLLNLIGKRQGDTYRLAF